MPQELRNLRIHEVSSVHRGAGEGVRIVLMKRDDESPPATATEKSMDDVKTLLRDAFAVPERLLDLSKLTGAQLAKLLSGCDAYEASIESIMKTEIGVDAGLEALEKSTDQFVSYVAGFAPEVSTAMKRGAEPMTTLKDQLAKALAASTDAEKATVHKELEASVASFEKINETLSTSKTALETTNKALETDVSLWKGRVLKAIRLEKAAKDHMNHPDNEMDEEAACKFLDMTATERAEYMKANPVEEMTQKRIDALPEPVRKQLAEGQAAAELVAKMQEDRDVEAFGKRAVELGQSTEFGKSLRLLAKGLGTLEERTAAYGMIEKALEAAAAQAKTAGLFKEFGTRGNGGGTANDELRLKAQELRDAVAKSGSEKPMSPDQAFAKVYEDPANRELVLRYKAEISRRSAA